MAKKIDFGKLFTHFIDEYTRHYNKHRLGALADFESIRSALNRQIEYIESGIKSVVESFKGDIGLLFMNAVNQDLITVEYEAGVEEIEYAQFRDDINQIVSEVFDITVDEDFDVRTRPYPIVQRRIFNLIKENYNQSKDAISPRKLHSFLESNLRRLRYASDSYVNIGRLCHNRHALRFVWLTALDRNYPERMPLLSEMTGAEQEEILKEGLSGFDLQEDKYWETARELYNNDDDSIKIWEDVWKGMKTLRNENEMNPRYTTFASFKRGKARDDEKRMKK